MGDRITAVFIKGVNGRMGKALTEVIGARGDCFVCAGSDKSAARDPALGFEVFPPCAYEGRADVIIDCSGSEGTGELLEYALRRSLPIVIMSTGHSEEQLSMIRAASERIPIFKSGNMSLGINVLSRLVRQASKLLGDSFDIEIVEAHHNKKKDAPSGTALMLASAASEGLEKAPDYVYERRSRREARKPDEIGIHSIRGGTIVGEHSVIFAGEDENLVLSHSAQSRKMFARGAVEAALFICSKAPGLYDMDDLTAEIALK